VRRYGGSGSNERTGFDSQSKVGDSQRRRSKFSLRIGGNAGGLSGGFVGDENLRAADRAALAGRNRTADGRRSCFLSDSDGQKAGENQAKATKAPQ